MKTKNFIIGLLLLFVTFGCANSKKFNIDGKDVVVEPYGWIDENIVKNDSVIYQINAGNVVWSILGFETIIIPVLLTGYQLYEPIEKK